MGKQVEMETYSQHPSKALRPAQMPASTSPVNKPHDIRLVTVSGRRQQGRSLFGQADCLLVIRFAEENLSVVAEVMAWWAVDVSGRGSWSSESSVSSTFLSEDGHSPSSV